MRRLFHLLSASLRVAGVGVYVVVQAMYAMVWSYWHGSLLWGQEGFKVTVVDTQSNAAPVLVRARVDVRRPDGKGMWTRAIEGRREIIGVDFAKRGITWCWGWEGEKVRALHAAAALS